MEAFIIFFIKLHLYAEKLLYVKMIAGSKINRYFKLAGLTYTFHFSTSVKISPLYVYWYIIQFCTYVDLMSRSLH